jgi:DNA polymerase
VSRYDTDNVGFVDYETKALPGATVYDGDVTKGGTYRYVKNAFAIIFTYAIGWEPVQALTVTDFENGAMRWDDLPKSMHEHHERVLQGKAVWCAHNAGFDRNAWNQCTYDFPELKPRHMICSMVQAMTSNLAASLEGASQNIGHAGKQKDGKFLIQLFCAPGAKATPQSHPAEWARFVSYGLQDVEAMREVYASTRQLPPDEWEDYFISERINERGMALDMHFIERAAAIADLNNRRINADLVRWTNGQITAVTQAARIADYVYDRIEFNEARDLLVKAYDENASTEDGDDEADLKPSKLSVAKDRLTAVLAFYEQLEKDEGLTERDQLIVDVLTARLYGGSSSPAKFDKMLMQHDDGALRGMYVFNGAQQTQRFSSKGVQTHNLTRSTLGKMEAEAIELINQLEL